MSASDREARLRLIPPPRYGEGIWRVRVVPPGRNAEALEREVPRGEAPLSERLAPVVGELLAEAGARTGEVRFETPVLAWLCVELEGRVGMWLGCRRNAALWRDAGRSAPVEETLTLHLGRKRRSEGGWQSLWLAAQAFPQGGPAGWSLVDEERELDRWAGYGRGAARVNWAALFRVVRGAPKRSSLRIHLLAERVFRELEARPDSGGLAEVIAERNLAVELVLHRSAKLPEPMLAAWLRANKLRWERLVRAPHRGGCEVCGRGMRIPTWVEGGAFHVACTECGDREEKPLGDLALRQWFVAIDCPRAQGDRGPA